jgi:VanZ family protein
VLGSLCGLVLCGILIAGLWPFHSPRNDVVWLAQGNGLAFGPHGSIVSSGEFKSSGSNVDSSCSIELWLHPKVVNGSGTVLAFYHSDFGVSLALRQSLSDLLVQVHRPKAVRSHIYVDRVFLSQSALSITITSGTQGTVAYVDGQEFQRFTTYHIRSEDLSGKLLVGNRPAGTDEWSGQVLALAIYNQELTPGEILQHYEDWTAHKVTAFSQSSHTVAIYPFNEGTGVVAHNQVDAGNDLLIPTKFFVVNAQFLTWPWNEYYPGQSYWFDIAINICGFIPLGFFFCAYLGSVRMTLRPILATVILGFVVSLTIEVLQALLPTRDSGWTDVITNTLGTAAGAMFYRYSASFAFAKVAEQQQNVDS